MEFNYAYQQDSLVDNSASRTDMSFAPDTLRQPTFFRGELRQNVAFREAISALNDVVVSDLRWHPKDRTAYKEWLARQEAIDWVEVAAQRRNVAAELKQVRDELGDLHRRRAERIKPFYSARQRYFDYLYKRDYDAWFVLDPVITVHPDEVFFECFSQDESSYGRLGVGFDVFQNVGEFCCGTTNVDYSSSLYNEFQKIRSYKQTKLEVDPSGFEVETSGEAAYKEIKIDLPDSWVRGFLQVSSAMALPARTLSLHPMDVYNICFTLRRRREQAGPRSMRYQLEPGKPVKIVFDPWGIELVCARSIYEGDRAEEIRVWGRRRIQILERLIPVAQRFTVHLLGQGMPSFYTADLGDMTFTLGLSGWTANDWSTAGNFDLLAPRADVDTFTKQRVFAGAEGELAGDTRLALAARLGLDRCDCVGSIGGVHTGRAARSGTPTRACTACANSAVSHCRMDRLRFTNEREQNARHVSWNRPGASRVKLAFSIRAGSSFSAEPFAKATVATNRRSASIKTKESSRPIAPAIGTSKTNSAKGPASTSWRCACSTRGRHLAISPLKKPS